MMGIRKLIDYESDPKSQRIKRKKRVKNKKKAKQSKYNTGTV